MTYLVNLEGESGSFEGDKLKEIVCDIARYYADDRREWVPAIADVVHYESDYKSTKFNRVLDGFINDKFENIINEEQDESKYRKQVNSYYNSTRGCK